jgi:non-specific serine/threonine protein kinase/serine/threonine-protein kinase
MDSRQVLARFGAERQALALMDHPNIAKVFDAGTTDTGRPYFVMELVKGVPITRFCDERRLTLRERLELAIPVCQAVQHAHQKGVIHRDLKPSNVLIALYDGKPVPKVIDFGVAKATGPRLTDQTLYTEFGAVVGTLEYMSPEQAEMNQLDIDTRSDIYSLGVLLYELLTGSTPLDRKRLKRGAILEMLRVIREEESPRPSHRLSSTEELPSIAACRNVEPRKMSGIVRGELDWIVMKALEKDRTRRYETASAMAADLRRYLDDEPVQACPPSARYRLGKLARRHRAALTTAVVVGVALTVGAAVSLLQAIRATRAERRTAAALTEAQQQRGEAGRKAAEAQAVVDFLVKEMIGAATPSRTQGRTITVVEVLARADERIDGRFAGQPLVEAAIRHTMGVVYGQLYRSDDKAERHLRRAVELRREHLGAEHSDTLGAMLSLANYLHGEASRALAQRVVDVRRPTLGSEHPDTLAAESLLAFSLMELDRLAEAQALFEHVTEAERRVLGPEDGEVLSTLQGLAWVLHRRGDGEGAEALFRRVLDARRRALGEDHPLTLWAASEFTVVLRARGKLDEARALGEPELERHDRVFDPYHAETSTGLVRLLATIRSQGRRGDVRSICEPRLTRLLGMTVPPDRYQRQMRADHLVLLAWNLLTVADPAAVDAKACVRAAEEAVAVKPGDGAFWNTLGLARYRAGDWKATIEALGKAKTLTPGQHLAFNWKAALEPSKEAEALTPGKQLSLNAFFLAMANWQLGDKPQARIWYDKAVQWMDKNQPTDEELIRFRAEAAALLEVKEKKN